MSQKLQRTIERTRQHGGLSSSMVKSHGGATTIGAKSRGSAVAGTASSVSFTPVHGLEIVTPQRDELASGKESVYFQPTTNFLAPTKPAIKKHSK